MRAADCRNLEKYLIKKENDYDQETRVANRIIHQSWLFPSYAGVVTLILAHLLVYALKSQKPAASNSLWSQLHMIANTGVSNPYGLMVYVFLTNFITMRLTKRMMK